VVRAPLLSRSGAQNIPTIISYPIQVMRSNCACLTRILVVASNLDFNFDHEVPESRVILPDKAVHTSPQQVCLTDDDKRCSI